MAKWMRIPGAEAPCIMVFRGEFEVKTAEIRDIIYSADERCQLYLDGVRVSEGPERGAPARWYYQNLKLELTPGKHVLCARVFAHGEKLSARAQTTVAYGFYIDGLDAKWSCQLENVELVWSFPDWGACAKVKVGSQRNHEILSGKGGVWQDVEYFDDTRKLFAPDLPLMRYDRIYPQEIRPGVFKFDEYVCAYADYHFSGKGKVSIKWSETPYYDPYVNPKTLKGEKRDRQGEFFYAAPDEFEVDGEYSWPVTYWRAGRYVSVEIEGDVQVKIDFFRTGYPLNDFKHDDPLQMVAYNTLRNCCFETFMDCPYYEQLMYIGDARIDALCVYKLGDDHRLVQKALRLLALGQNPDGSLRSQFPSVNKQEINSFMLVYMLMLNDYYQRHGRDEVVCEVLPVVEKLLVYLRNQMKDGLLYPHDGWNFIDWCEGWDFGSPIGDGPNSVLNLFYILALRAHSETSGNPELKKEADALLDVVRERFFDHEKGIFYDFVGNPAYSEHAQIMALLCEVPEKDIIIKSLMERPKLIPCSIYFSFYYLMACRKYGLGELFHEKMDKFRVLLKENLTTLPEEFNNPRSDCHAWSSHIMLDDGVFTE